MFACLCANVTFLDIFLQLANFMCTWEVTRLELWPFSTHIELRHRFLKHQ
jgi:hypothetical protein